MRRLLALLSLFLVVSITQAEDKEPSRGRLADGRAFRTDATGNQLVDYIAELEVNIETLQRKVVGLEDELQDKDRQLTRVKSGQSASPQIVEKDLSGQPTKLSAQPETKTACPQVSCPQVSCPAARDCSAEIKQVNAALDSARSDLEIERQLNATKQAELNEQIVSLKEAISEKESEIGVTKTRLEEQRKARAEVQERLDATRADAPTAASYSTDSRAALSSARLRAVEAVRGKMQTELNQLKGLITTRDQMYYKYSQQKRTVAFKPGRPISGSGKSIEEISRRIQSAQSVSDLSPLRRDISDIEEKVQDDLALMHRTEKLR